ncbi:hypothetical protein K493DRAFT_407244 [Basidiobolus meristosporus CBS 931.73]|uniref:RlpA-like protein double-psi beta-barrel domain-containing protein n=1 Tax=Basidiobolus meristosporus CBS 931.73 TaxID=1314790 RepID=A0A1Y1YEN3_9FUNG|nr:hypothetical protein K493DRAFT_407244 [Basidiobolus meristosporus CBS 931.73]|eukprot:ORX96405.1 hypothetical protein K493DRAFT_407244 [Basidiobolus meristosporus CBS 931.73]
MTLLVAALSATQVYSAPVQNEAGLRMTKRASFTGDATYYDPGLGSCELTSTANELIAALNAPQYGSFPRPSNSPACSSCAMVQGPKGSVKVKIVDKCPSCKHGDLDLSPAAFDRIADQAQGRVTITWSYVSCGGGSSEAPSKDTTTDKNGSGSKDQESGDKNTSSGSNQESGNKETVEKPKNDATTVLITGSSIRNKFENTNTIIMTGFKLFNTMTLLVAALSATQVYSAPVQNEAGLRMTKRASFTGDATYYDPGLGSCELTSTANELIAALNAPQYGSFPRPSNSPACSSCAMVQGPKGSVKVKIVDKCPSCKHGDLDLSPAAFDRIADQAQGRVTITWSYVSCGGGSSEAPSKDTTTDKNDSGSKDQESGDKNTSSGSNQESGNKETVEKPKNDATTEFETCVHGSVKKQTCARGTVCKASDSDIICTWA